MKTVAKLLKQHQSLVFPGVHDGLSALIARDCEFPIAFVSGYAVAATYLGLPDMGFLNQSDMVDVVRRCSLAVPDLPLIADADTGYGNDLNVRQTIRKLIQAGAKGCFLEDQEWPKRCGHMRGKSIIDRAEYVAKLTAAVDEIGTADFFLVARTDALAVAGYDEALARMHTAKEVGVDGFFIEAPADIEQMRKLCTEAPKPLVANMIEGGHTPVLTRAELTEIGYVLILYPLTALFSSAKAIKDTLSNLAATGVSKDQTMLPFNEFNQLIRVPDSAARDGQD